MSRRQDNQDMYVLLGERMKDIKSKIDDSKQERVNEIVASIDTSQELATLDTYTKLNNRDKIDYMYKVKPYYREIAEMVENGFKMTAVAKTLGVPYRSLERMRGSIPELEEVFTVAEIALVETVENNLELLTQPRIVWEERANPKTGEVDRLEKIVEPSFQALKYVLEKSPHSKQKYRDEKTIVHEASLSPEFEKMLANLSTSDLKSLHDDVENVIDAEFSEVD